MKTGKLILFNSLGFFSMLLVILTYSYYGFPGVQRSWDYVFQVIPPLVTLLVLWISMTFTSLSYIVSKVLHRKNLLRASIIPLLILTLTSIITRILEFVEGVFCIVCILLTIIYIVLLCLNISILNDLYRLVKELFLDQK